MFIYQLTALINAATSILLGIFVYFQDRKSTANKYFSLFAFSVAFWSIAYIFWQQEQDRQSALWFIRIAMIGAIFIPVFYFHFVASLVKLADKTKVFLIFGYISAILFAFSDLFTPYFIQGVSPKLSFLFWPEPGPAFHVFLLMFFGYAVASWYLLLYSWKKVEGIRKDQILYVFWGTFIGFLGGSTNYFLWYDIPIPPAGNWAVAVYVAMIAYAIVTKKLFDVKVVLTEILVGVIALLLLANIFPSQAPFEYLWKGALFAAFLFAGYLLIKSVLREVEQREKLEELSKAKSEFMSIASHQLRTPLSIVKGYLSLMREGSFGKTTEKQQEVLGKVYATNDEMMNMVNDLLNVTRAEEGRLQYSFEKTDLKELVQTITKGLEVSARKKNLELRCSVPQDLVFINADKDKLGQVVSNLIDNAIKYTEQGAIEVQLTTPKPGTSLIAVKDTGLGIRKEEMPQLFESFTRGKAGTKLWTKGSGMGLYIAKQFVSAHKGKIWAESEGEGKGSAFFVELPLIF